MSIWHGCSRPVRIRISIGPRANRDLKGNKSVVPESKYIDVPARAVTKDGRKVGDQKSEQVDEFWVDLKEKVGN
jgi:hypothetical protein